MQDRGERIGKMIVNMGLVKEALVDEALELSKKNGRSFGQNLVALGHVSDSSLMQLIVAQGAASPWSFEDGTPDARYLRLVSASVMREHMLVPVQRFGDLLIIAMQTANDHAAMERIRALTGLRVECVEADINDITKIIETVINAGRKEEKPIVIAQPTPVVEQAPDAKVEPVVQAAQAEPISVVQNAPIEKPKVTIESEVVSEDDTAPVAGLVDQIIADSVRRDATEILIESVASGLSIRYRVDGRLRSIGDVPKSVAELVLARFRMLSSLDLLDTNSPMRGTLRHKTASKEFAFEANFAPTSQGHRLLLRRSNAMVASKKLEDLGLARNELDLLRRSMADGEGLLIVAAPTSQLRTSALYSILSDLAAPTREIVTVEETCGVPIQGVSHTSVIKGIARAKATQLEHVARGSSDVLMVDGLEEESVAELATRSALAGRLVIAGIEAKSAISVIDRLHELGVDRRFIAASICGVLSVRQVRTLCKSCKKQEAGQFRAVGCPDCESTGYKGTVDLFEFLPVNDDVSRLIADGAHISEIERAATKAGLRSIAEYATKRIERGETDVREVQQALNITLAPMVVSVPKILIKEITEVREPVAVHVADEGEVEDYSKELELERAQLNAHFGKESFQLEQEYPPEEA